MTKEKILNQIAKRLEKRLNKRDGELHVNRHETFGKVTEEYNEYAFEVQKQSNRKQRNELLDIIDACVIGILSIDNRKKK